MEQRMNDQKLGSGLARNQYFAKGEGQKPQVEKFNKYFKIGRRSDQISATQMNRRRGGTPSRWVMFCNFLEKIPILMPFGSQFIHFQSHLKEQNF